MSDIGEVKVLIEERNKTTTQKFSELSLQNDKQSKDIGDIKEILAVIEDNLLGKNGMKVKVEDHDTFIKNFVGGIKWASASSVIVGLIFGVIKITTFISGG